MFLGEQVYQLRKACCLTQDKLSWYTGIRQDKLSVIERNLYPIGLIDLVNMTNNCHVSIQDFLNLNLSQSYVSENRYIIRKEDRLRKMLLGVSIKKHRENRNISIKQLSEMINVARYSIICYEMGNHLPKVVTLLDISNILGTDIDTMIVPFIKGISNKELRDSLYKYL